MNIALFLAQGDQTVALERAHKVQVEALNEFQIVAGGIPTIKEDRLGLELLVMLSAQQHFAKMVVLGFAIPAGVIDAIIHGVEVPCRAAMEQIQHTNAAHQPMFSPTVL